MEYRSSDGHVYGAKTYMVFSFEKAINLSKGATNVKFKLLGDEEYNEGFLIKDGEVQDYHWLCFSSGNSKPQIKINNSEWVDCYDVFSAESYFNDDAGTYMFPEDFNEKLGYVSTTERWYIIVRRPFEDDFISCVKVEKNSDESFWYGISSYKKGKSAFKTLKEAKDRIVELNKKELEELTKEFLRQVTSKRDKLEKYISGNINLIPS